MWPAQRGSLESNIWICSFLLTSLQPLCAYIADLFETVFIMEPEYIDSYINRDFVRLDDPTLPSAPSTYTAQSCPVVDESYDHIDSVVDQIFARLDDPTLPPASSTSTAQSCPVVDENYDRIDSFVDRIMARLEDDPTFPPAASTSTAHSFPVVNSDSFVGGGVASAGPCLPLPMLPCTTVTQGRPQSDPGDQ